MSETERYAFRFLHTILRVRNMDRMIAFYTDVLGISVLRRFEVEPKRETLCFLGYGDENVDAVVELLCQEWERKEPYQVAGQGYGHFARRRLMRLLSSSGHAASRLLRNPRP
jgi:lactoylglutathione lyase